MYIQINELVHRRVSILTYLFASIANMDVSDERVNSIKTTMYGPTTHLRSNVGAMGPNQKRMCLKENRIR